MFTDRNDAGRKLAERLAFLKDDSNVIVLGIPRGGIIVAAEIARALAAPLDIFISHKISAPDNPEFALGALTSAGEVWLDEAIIEQMHFDRARIARQIEQTRGEIARRMKKYRGKRQPLDGRGKTVIVADDGVATGSTMFAALRALRKQAPARLLLAVPVGPPETMKQLALECDEVVVLHTPAAFWAVSRFYTAFEQVEDAQVAHVLEKQKRKRGAECVK